MLEVSNLLLNLSKALNSQTKTKDTPTLIFFRSVEKEEDGKESRTFSVLVNLNKVELEVKKSTFGRDVLEVSKEFKFIAKLEFVYSEYDFTLEKLAGFVKNKEKTLECAKKRMNLGIMAMFASFYNWAPHEDHKQILAGIRKSGKFPRKVFKHDNEKAKIDCLAQLFTFSLISKQCLAPLYAKDSRSFYKDADKMIIEFIEAYAEVASKTERKIKFLVQSGYNDYYNDTREYLKEVCDMNI